MPRMGFESKISVFEGAKQFLALDHQVTVISIRHVLFEEIHHSLEQLMLQSSAFSLWNIRKECLMASHHG
jgi:hypothetical protein